MTAVPISLPASEIAKVRDRLAAEWGVRPSDLNITSVVERVILVERDTSPIVPRHPRIACDGVSAKETG